MFLKYRTVLAFGKYFITLTVFSFYCVYWLCIRALDFILDIFSFQSHDSSTNTAKIGTIIFKRKLSLMIFTSSLDFICVFRNRVRPEYVLQPNVSLYFITNKEAVFVETPAGLNIYSSDTHPFFFIAQFLNATKVIKMPIKDFVDLSDKVGDPTVPVTWMSSTGRCGGTMVCQLFETVPGAIAIHEPDPPSNVYHMKGNANVKISEYETILKSMIRIMCKPHPGVTRILIKPRPLCTFMLDDINKLCPNVKHIFMYRNSLDTMRSWLALLTYDSYVAVARTCIDAIWFSNLFSHYRNALRLYLTSHRSDEPEMPSQINTICMYFTNWANQICYAREKIARGQIVFALKYEDAVSQPKESITNLFECLGIDRKHIERALVSLSRDSQRGSPVSRENIGDSSHRFIPETDKVKFDSILTKRKLPRMGEDLKL